MGIILLIGVIFVFLDETEFWKPKGRIIYVKYIDSTMALYVMDPDGSQMDRLTGDSVRVASPVWSPDGKEIAFGCSSIQGNDLCVGKVVPWKSGTDIIGPLESVLLFDGLHIHSTEYELCEDPIKAVSWASDQQRLAFVCSGPREERSGYYDLICITDRDGTSDCFPMTKLYDDLAAYSLEVRWIAWSPVEDVLAASLLIRPIDGPNRTEIYLMDLSGQSLQFLASGWNATWAADGKRIYYFSDEGLSAEEDSGLSGIAIIDKNGENKHIVYHYPDLGTKGTPGSVFRHSKIDFSQESVFAISPDERYIATNAFRGVIEKSAIYLIDLKTKKIRMLTVPGDGQVFTPDWSP